MAKAPFFRSLSGWLTIGGIVLLLVAGGIIGNTLLNSRASDWAYEITGIRDLQGQGYTGKGIRVAVIDTGIDRANPSFDGAKVVAWRDFVNGQAEPYDDGGHGSHVAGVIVGQGGGFASRIQGYNVVGAAPDADLIVAKVISKSGTGTASNVAAGISWAVASGAEIICLSLGNPGGPLFRPVPGSPEPGDQIQDAVNNAIDRGVLVVAAAGNTGQNSSVTDVVQPADEPGVIAVGAIDEDRRVAPFSARGNSDANYGSVGGVELPTTRSHPNKKPEVVAPGVGIRSAWMGGAYATADGTSQAVPFVCGGLAQLLEAKPGLRAQDSRSMVNNVKSKLMATAEDIPQQRTPHDPRAGYGLFRADKLVAAL